MDWHNGNIHRTYPLVDNPGQPVDCMLGGVETESRFPDTAIADIFVIAWHAAGFVPATDKLWLSRVDKDGNTFIFTFSSTSTDELLVFEIPVTAEEFATHYAVTLDDNTGQPIVEGWLTIGNLDDLAALMDDGDWWSANAVLEVEPALIQSMYGRVVTGITVVNAGRIRVTPAEGCGDAEPYESHHVLARSLQGHVKFEEGFNSSIRTTAGTSTLAFGAGRGSGQGEPTEEVPVFHGEEPPTGSQLLTGGPRCDELISSINGVPGPVVPVLGGIGVDVGYDTEMPHTLVVAVTLRGLAVCDEFEDEEP